jgi:hypothetical protein
MWIVSGVLVIIWFILKFILHKGGYVHMLLLFSISLFIVQLAAHRKTKYQQNSAKR